MKRSFTREKVAGIVQETVGTHQQTLHGFEWERGGRGWRLQSGGGIAGNSRVWWLVERAGSNPIMLGPLTTVKGLQRVLLGHLGRLAIKSL